jgi:hypothetical protein
MSRMFRELINRSRRISRDEFSLTFGNVANEVVDMLSSDSANKALQEARSLMEQSGTLPNGMPRLMTKEFGLFSTAIELEQGDVAAVDGTPALPLQIYSPGQALCVGIGSLSYRRPMQDSIHFWSAKMFLEDAQDTDDFISKQEQGIFGISQTAYMRYFEVQHALEIKETFVLLDGTLVYEWLVGLKEGVALYNKLFASKKCLGVIKNIKTDVVTATYARALRPGEVFIVETLNDHFEGNNAANKNHGESAKRGVLEEFKPTAKKIVRGLFKPSKKVFGFEVHLDHFADLLRIMVADCQLNNVGHEIPYLLNRVDEEVRTHFKPTILKNRIAATMAQTSEELFFEETDERDFRR